MFNFFSSKRFKSLYFDMAATIAKELSLDMSKLNLQTTPTLIVLNQIHMQPLSIVITGMDMV